MREPGPQVLSYYNSFIGRRSWRCSWIALREKPEGADDLPARLGADDRFPLSETEVRALLSDPLDFVGDARRQVATFVARVGDVVASNPHAATYQPEPIL